MTVLFSNDNRIFYMQSAMQRTLRKMPHRVNVREEKLEHMHIPPTPLLPTEMLSARLRPTVISVDKASSQHSDKTRLESLNLETGCHWQGIVASRQTHLSNEIRNVSPVFHGHKRRSAFRMGFKLQSCSNEQQTYLAQDITGPSTCICEVNAVCCGDLARACANFMGVEDVALSISAYGSF